MDAPSSETQVGEFVFDTPPDDRSGKPLISLKSAIFTLWMVVMVLVAARVVLVSNGMLFHFSPSTWTGVR